MSDIRFNQWLHQSGTGGVSQVASGAVGVGTTNPLADFYVRGDAQITGILTAGHIAMGSSITFGDNDRIYLGDGTDFQLYHASSDNNSYIVESGAGSLVVNASKFHVKNAANNEDVAVFNQSGNNELYFSNSKKFETTNTGTITTGISTVTGVIDAQGYINLAQKIIHTGDADTSIEFPSNDTIRFETGGSEVLSMNLDGLVTGGQTNPTSSDNGNIYIKNASSIGGVGHAVNYVSNAVFNSAWKYITSSQGATRIVVNQNGFTFDTAASGTAGNNITFSERFRIKSDGKVGINSNSPDRTLNITSVTGGNCDVELKAANNTGWCQLIFSDTDAAFRGGIGYEHQNNYMAFYTGAQDERLRIDSDGRLLVNGAASGNAFSGGDDLIIGSTSARSGITLVSSGSNDGGLYFSKGTSANSDYVMGQFVYHHDSDGGYMRFFTNANERLRITSDGHVLFSGLQTKHDTRNAKGITIKSSSSGGGISFQNFGANGSRNWRIRPDDQSAWGCLDISVSPTANSNTDWPDTTSDVVLALQPGREIDTGVKTITGGTNLAIQNYRVKGIWSGTPSIGKEIELISGYDGNVKMAAIGYNLTDVNVGGTYGGDLVFHTQPSYSSPTTPIPESMRINSSGHVTKSKTPFVMVTINTTTNRNATNGYQVLPWDTIHGKSTSSNVGSHFNTSNHRFTAPVAGRYFFCLSLNIVGDNIVKHRINGSDVSKAEYRMTQNVWDHIDASFIYDMNKNDYYDVISSLTGTGQRWNGGGTADNGWDTLSIYLLG